MGTKNEGDRCYDAALDDEPMFVLLARDPSAPALVRQWAAIRRVDIECGTRPRTDLPQVEEAERLAERMKQWRIDADEVWRKQPSFFDGPLSDIGDAVAAEGAFRDAGIHGGIADKIARILSGDPNYTYNWHDIQGYAKLAEDRCVNTMPKKSFMRQIGKVQELALGYQGSVERQSTHLLDRQGDEFFCPRCTKRWGADEDAPEACTDAPHSPDFRSGGYELGN